MLIFSECTYFREMKKRRIGRKILLTFLALLLLANIAIVVTGNTYMYKALTYYYADIDDLKIFPSRLIPNGTPQPWPVAADYNKRQLPDSIRKVLEQSETVSYLVIKNDSIKFEEYWAGYNDHSQSNSFSMAKSFIGLMIGIAHEEGKIKSLDDQIGIYLPQFSKDNVTIRNLLSMSSGSTWDESYSSLTSITTKAYYGSDLEKVIREVKIDHAPGKVWEYKSGDTQMLAFILEKATGKTLSEYASEKIWSKIGAEQPALWSLDHKDGHEKAYCCIYSSARDFARMGKLLMDSGEWNGQQIISKDYVRQSLTANGLVYDDDSTTKVYTYGYQFWLLNYKNHDVFYLRGLKGQYVLVIPDERMIVVRLGKKRLPGIDNRHPLELNYILQGALSMYGS